MAEKRPPSWDIQKLDRSHERDSFDCGKPPLNVWLQRLAGQFERRDLARTYVALPAGERTVQGYYSLANHHVSFDVLPEEEAKGLPAMDIPVVLLGRLAVDARIHGQGLGEFLLLDAMRRASHVSQHVAVRAMEVHALDDDARKFYLKYGFLTLRDDQHHLFMPMRVVRQLKLPAL